MALIPLAAGCSSGKKQPPSATATSATPTTQAARPLELKLSTTAKGPGRGFNADKAAKDASPGLERFLSRYLTLAFLEPDQAKSGWSQLLALFDGSVRPSAKKQLDSLSLGGAATQVTTVRPGSAQARAVVLYSGGGPAAATVRLSFDGTADSGQGSGPVRLRSVFQLLRTKSGWQIAAYESKTGSQR